MHTVKRITVASIVAIAILLGGVTTASAADYETTIHSWYKSKATCAKNGSDLVATGKYYRPRCSKNSYDSRWTLRMMVRTAGGGGGGGGTGGWIGQPQHARV